MERLQVQMDQVLARLNGLEDKQIGMKIPSPTICNFTHLMVPQTDDRSSMKQPKDHEGGGRVIAIGKAGEIRRSEGTAQQSLFPLGCLDLGR